MTWKLALLIGAAGILMLLGSAYLNRRAGRAGNEPVDPEALRTDVAAALARDDLPEAVHIYRRRTGAGLLEAADAVQRIDGERH